MNTTNTGSRAAVYHGNAMKTTGGLRKKDLYKNKRGRIVSMKKSKTAKNWNPLKMMGLLSKSGEAFGARTFGRGTLSTTRLGASGQRVLDFMTHKGSRVKRHGKKYKAYYSRKGSRRKTNKFKLGRDYSQSGGMQPLSYSSYPGDVPDFSNGTGDAFSSNPQMRALQAGAGSRRGGGMQPLTYSSYPGDVPDFSNGTGDAFTSNPQIRALQAGAGRKTRSRSMSGGGLQPLQMTSLSAANSAPMVNENYGINSPLGRALNAAA